MKCTAPDRPMWCDDFDMDLPKVIPDARRIIGEFGDVLLWTTGHETNGVLNHPTVWNGDGGMVAFFGLKPNCRPASYWTNVQPIRCTVWEAIRDAWTHQYRIHIDGVAVWDTNPLWRPFETIMWDIRGWRTPRDPSKVSRARTLVRRSLRDAHGRLVDVLYPHRDRLERVAV